METRDLAGVRWSPDDRSIGVWDSCVDYLFLAYSPDGRCLGRYQVNTCTHARAHTHTHARAYTGLTHAYAHTQRLDNTRAASLVCAKPQTPAPKPQTEGNDVVGGARAFVRARATVCLRARARERVRLFVRVVGGASMCMRPRAGAGSEYERAAACASARRQTTLSCFSPPPPR